MLVQPPSGSTKTYAAPRLWLGNRVARLAPTTMVRPLIATAPPKSLSVTPSDAVNFAICVMLDQPCAGLTKTYAAPLRNLIRRFRVARPQHQCCHRLLWWRKFARHPKRLAEPAPPTPPSASQTCRRVQQLRNTTMTSGTLQRSAITRLFSREPPTDEYDQTSTGSCGWGTAKSSEQFPFKHRS